MLKKIDSDWLSKYDCHVNNQSEMLLEMQLTSGVNKLLLIFEKHHITP